MVDYQKEIEQTETELRSLEKQQSNAKLLLRVQLLRVLKSGQFFRLKEAVTFLGITAKHGYDLWHKYRSEGLTRYLQLNYKTNQGKLSSEQQTAFLRRAEQGFASQNEAGEFIKDHFGVSYTQQGISVLFRRLKIKAKVARPFNIKAEADEQREYKKTFG